jgi:hypothetical protein
MKVLLLPQRKHFLFGRLLHLILALIKSLDILTTSLVTIMIPPNLSFSSFNSSLYSVACLAILAIVVDTDPM